VQFLHCLRNPDWLEQSIRSGLMLTSHPVKFQATDDLDQLGRLLDQIMPLLLERLEGLGRPWGTLSEERRQLLMRGIGSVSGEVPMVCFTAVPPGKLITEHRSVFGDFGVVASRAWIETNGGDRIVYVGDNSALSQTLFLAVGTMNIFSLHIVNGEPMYENRATSAALRLVCSVERRTHLNEDEWRIWGNPGWMGGRKEVGKRIALPLDEIELVLAPTAAEAKRMEAIVSDEAKKQHARRVPQCIVFPDALPAT
jgi:hypothetical protein